MVKKSWLYLISLFIVGFFYILLYNSNISNIVDFNIYDVYSKQKLQNDQKLQNTIVIKIDQKSIENIGQWPWSRIVIAKIVQEVLKSRPASLGIDIIFSEADRTSPKVIESFYKHNLGIDANLSSIPEYLNDNDHILASTLNQSNVVIPIIALNQSTPTKCDPQTFIKTHAKLSDLKMIDTFTCNIPIIQSNSKNSGFINASIDTDGLLRHYDLLYKYKKNLIPSLGISMLNSVDENMHASEKNMLYNYLNINFFNTQIKANQQAQVLNYLHPESSFNTISASDIFDQNFDNSIFTGKFVLIGTTAIGLSDLYITQAGEKTSGIFAHASFIENAISNTLFFTPNKSQTLVYILSFIIAICISILILFQRYLYAGFLCFGSIFFVAIFDYFMLNYNIYLPIGHFITPLFISYTFILFILSFILEKEEQNFLYETMQTRSYITNNMMMMIESRDTETGKHIERTKEFAKILADELAQNSIYSTQLTPQLIQTIHQATPLHDIGKIGIADHILKKPNILNENEREIMKTHAKIGYQIIINSLQKNKTQDHFIQVAANIAYTHHEKYDGTGYPQGLSGQNIPLEGRIVALVDVYDALISLRCYKDPIGFEESENIIIQNSGKHFDPIIVDAFKRVKHIFKQIAKENTDSNYAFS